MSEFTCENGHIMSGYRCSICGGRIKYMDGMSNRALEEYERDYDSDYDDSDNDDV